MSATGTTATAGCGTPRSPCRLTGSTSTGRPTSSCSSSPTSSPTMTAACRSCTGSTAAETSRNRRSTTSADTTAPAGGSATARYDQRQNDVFGAVLDASCSLRRSQRLPHRLWPIVEAQADVRHQGVAGARPGHLGERGKPQHYVSSKLMCWVALDRAAKLAEMRGDSAPRATWQATPTRSTAMFSSAVSTGGACFGSTTTPTHSTPTLLAPIFGFWPGGDERAHPASGDL